ncbi:MAG: acyl carrier protein [bacterium]
MEDIIRIVKEFILDKFLPGEDPAALTPSTQLMSSGILDSLATLDLVSFLEERFKIELEARETDVSRMGTLNDIAQLVQPKLPAGK